MVYSAHYRLFSDDKNRFFSDVHTIEEARDRADEKDYRFLADNRQLIEEEFTELFNTLRNKSGGRAEFWFYCYYCCVMLQNYYSAYDSLDKAESYRKQAEKIWVANDSGHLPEDEVESLRTRIAADLSSLVSTPRRTSKIRDWLGFINIYRIHFNFCRITSLQSVLVANELHWLEKLEQMLGLHMNADEMLSNLSAPAPFFNVLSVGIFAARFIVNAGVLLKHIFMPTREEKALSAGSRFFHELYKRHCTLLNDTVWGTVNLLTNYPSLLHLSASLANWLTAGFLIFDVSLLLYRRHLAESEYLLKKAEYLSEKRNLQTLLLGADLTDEERSGYIARCALLDEQLNRHDVNWKTTNATFLFNVAAAALFLGGFSASLVFMTPAVIVACYFVCNIAIAMYLTADVYGKYKEKSYLLQQQKLEDQDTTKALIDMQSARNDFILAMAKNIIIPMLIVATFAICWEAALVLTALYVGYECTHRYRNRSHGGKLQARRELTPELDHDDSTDEVEDLTSRVDSNGPLMA